MSKFVIEGGNKLQGKIKIFGSKNSILPCLAACLLTEDEVVLKNVPQISDVGVMGEILKQLGANVESTDHQIKIKASQITNSKIPEELVGKLRASILLVGPLLSRTSKAEFSYPGGDVVGKRSIDTHLEAFEKLGFEFQVSDNYYLGSRKNKLSDRHEIFLSEASVTATENIVLASVIGSSAIILKNCAVEPHVVDLCQMLNLMGAKISGVGTQTLTITGVPKLSGAEFAVRSDYIEFATYAITAALTDGEIEIEKNNLPELEPITSHLEKMGVIFEESDSSITVKRGTLTALPELKTNIWPGFPTDVMSVAIVLATQASGVTLCHDWMYESRMFFADKLISMGANLTIADPHRVLVYGPTPLYGRNLETPDIRAGMALVLAALIAHGRSTINKAELIERGYEDVVGKLSAVGAKIERVDV